MRVFLSNLGCKLNQSETDSFARRFLAHGHEVVGSLAVADLHVVNSCTVTHLAARDSRKAARRGARQGSGVRTVLTGCYASAAQVEARGLSGVDLVVPNADKDRLVELVEQRFGIESAAPTVPASFVPLSFGPTRALLKVEDGCGMACSFCIIPSTRGPQRSRPIDEVVAEAQNLERAGYREIVVTGVQISAYRDDGLRLPGLLERLLDATRSCRFRLTSIAPWDFAPDLVELLQHPRVCRHVHLSLQSGSESVLTRMRRPYSPQAYSGLVAQLRREVAGIAVTTDVIVGFPGETDVEFEESRRFVAELEFSRVHAFTYSAREETSAAALPDPVAHATKKERMQRMLSTARAGAAHFLDLQAGLIGTALWEEQRRGRWRGMTGNYVRVFVDSANDLRGLLTPVRFLGPVADGVDVELAEPA
ncbi:MAG: MiaB/RimO family radical SAM methylthiotransferase [Acidobacteriota bacterium]|nr:MiaB/RimO family radical SAM methylthiotransferase [Acidobacteriota bacterium]